MRLREVDPDKDYKEHKDYWFYVYERDNSLCQLCGREGQQQHHVIMKSKGGRNSPNNTILLCKKCHDNQHTGERESVNKLLDRISKNEIRFKERLV